MSTLPGRVAAFGPKAIAVAVGRELQLARHDLGWTRRHAVRRVTGVSVCSLDNYELGMVMCPLATVVRLCRSMSVPAPDLLELAMQRTPVDLHLIALHVDLPAVRLDRWPPRSLRWWAEQMWCRGLHRSGVVRVPPRTLVWLARTSNIQPELLLTYLAGKGPQSIRGSNGERFRVEPDPNPTAGVGLTKELFSQALGAGLRTLRTDRNWTVTNVTSHLPGLIRATSWYGYEWGRVHCSIARLIEIGRIFDMPAPVLLRRALRRLDMTIPALGLLDDPGAVPTGSEAGHRGDDGHRAATPTPSGQP